MTTQSTRYNFISETADGMGFAARLTQDGHDVRMWIRNAEAKSVGDRIVTKVGDVEDMLHDAEMDRDVFIFDVSGNGCIADFIRDHGFPVVGGSVLADRLERDRTFGYSVMRDCDIEIPETQSFTSFDDGIRFIEEHSDVRWVYKPSKQLGDLSPSHVSYDAEDLIEMLDGISHDVDIADPQFELQSFEKGIAYSTELWFQHGEFISPLTNHTLERKELLNEDLGPSGGCLGNLVWFCEGCKVCSIAKQLIPWAERHRYHGMLDLNVIIRKRDGGVSGLEFTPRFGYDASPTLLWELIQTSPGDFLAAISRGTVRELRLRDGFAGALRVTIPPWPTEKYTAEEGVPVRGVEDVYDPANHFYLYNVKRDKDDNLVSAGAWGIIGLFTNHSSNPVSVFNKPLDACRALKLKNKQFRTDLAKRFAEDFEKLEAAGAAPNPVMETA